MIEHDDQFDAEQTLLAGERRQGEDDRATANSQTFDPGVGKPTNVAGQLPIGSVVKDRFVIEGIVGRGGMGVVYQAKDLRKEEAQDRDPRVALKVLSDQYRLNPAMVIALQREARKAQALAHPAITTVYDFDRDADMVYITMEMLDGQPLDEVIAEHPNGMPKKDVLPMVRGLCLGLAYAHNKNIIHSDFKPANIFLTADNRVKILDFGIARAAPLPEGDVSDVTRFDAGGLGGLTPSYASTEMLSGADPHPSDDVYALAIVTYELLTGRHPFDGASAVQAKANGLKPAHVPHLHRREWRAIRHGLAFDREDRTAHAAEFLEELEGAPKLRMFLGATAVALALSLSYVAFREYQNIAARMPDIAYEDLPVETRQSFNALINDARTFGEFGDVTSALDFYVRAYRMHPRNTEAVDGITRLVVKSFEAAAAGGRADDLVTLKSNLDAVMSIDDYLATHETLVETSEAITELM